MDFKTASKARLVARGFEENLNADREDSPKYCKGNFKLILCYCFQSVGSLSLLMLNQPFYKAKL